MHIAFRAGPVGAVCRAQLLALKGRARSKLREGWAKRADRVMIAASFGGTFRILHKASLLRVMGAGAVVHCDRTAMRHVEPPVARELLAGLAGGRSGRRTSYRRKDLYP